MLFPPSSLLSAFIIVFFTPPFPPLSIFSLPPPWSPLGSLHILMLLSPLHSHCDSGGQACSNLSQMSLKNTGFLRRLLSPLTKRPIISLSNHRAGFWGLPARLHMHYSRRPSKTLLWVIYNDTRWLCCCQLLSPHRRQWLGSRPMAPVENTAVLHNIHCSCMDFVAQHAPEGTFSVLHVNAAPDLTRPSVQSPSRLSWGCFLSVMLSLGWGFHLGLADSRSLLRQKDITSLWGQLPSRLVTFTLLSTGQEAHGIQVQTNERQRRERRRKICTGHSAEGRR